MNNDKNDTSDDISSFSNQSQPAGINLPKGGGAIRGIDEKFQVNAATGTSSFSITIPFSPSRGRALPKVSLSYNSGSGNSPFGLGWQLGVPSITRKTDKKLPTYRDGEDEDTFMISGSEDLVPLLQKVGDTWEKYRAKRTANGATYEIRRYRPRTEGAFTRIEKWKNELTGEVHWKTISSGNVHSYYGLTDESRLHDPYDDTRVYSWVLCRMHGDKGNITLYNYKKEDFANIPRDLNEKNRFGNCTQIYLKKILYGNKTPYYLGNAIPDEEDFMFKTIFDYGEHSLAENIPVNIDQELNSWPCRKDPFSEYKAGFEIRTYRRCSRIFIFHCFDDELPHNPYLTKSMQFFYNEALRYEGSNSEEGFSYLVRARQNGHKWDEESGHYTTKFLPELTLNYQQHEWNTDVKFVTSENAVHAPAGLQDSRYLWIDFFSEGISGILTEQGGALYYKHNLGDGRFEKVRLITPKPSFRGVVNGRLVLQDLEGDGNKYLVNYAQEPKGFFKQTDQETWEPFRHFVSSPNFGPGDPNTRTIDLSGNGQPDFLKTEENCFLWTAAAGEKGFDVPRRVQKAIDEEKGPAILFSDNEQSIFLTDMSGDGLTDIVRIRNGEICYWPNLGYGYFGSKVSMDNSPVFDHPEKFDPEHIRLGDIDGSGTTDIIYLGKNDFRVWMNQNGNKWSANPRVLGAFPAVHNLSDVKVMDFLGNGTACIVYSTSLGNQPIWYIDLMGSKKPHLLTGYENNTGFELTIAYKSSTHYYLEDKKQGNKWITKLPFPVHCVDSVRSEDKIRETVFVSSYRYSHGFFDNAEREFRGFARVEQLDTEDFAIFSLNNASNVVQEDLHQPPVKTVTWFHTGAYIKNKKILHQCENEYFQNPLVSELKMPEPVFDTALSAEEQREAFRALKGLPLRAEIYAVDGSEKSVFPYVVEQKMTDIRRIQPKAGNKYASFQVIPSESISYSYERDPGDPRIGHTFTLETDDMGMVLKSASVIYPRTSRPGAPHEIPDKVWNEQNKLQISYGEAFFTNDIDQDDAYRLRVAFESKSYEVSGVTQPPGFYLSKEGLKSDILAASEILFEDEFTSGLEKRLIGNKRVDYLKDDMYGPLPLGQLSVLAIGHKSYKMAFTKNLVSKYYGSKVTSAMLTDAKYIHSGGDEHWWVQSGTAIYSANPENDFYLPAGTIDVYGNQSSSGYDTFNLMVELVTDAIGNTVTAINDYRILAPIMMTDPNLNRSAVETDELGMVTRSAVMGKVGNGEGDTLDDPTVRMEYELFNWKNNSKPNFVHTFAREKHGPANPRWQEGFMYSDGVGNIIMAKAQAEPGTAKRWNTTTNTVEEIHADPRWVGNGRVVLNNKGKPVKEYEPYFSATHEYESESGLVETGVSPVVFYDPMGRTIRADFPNGSFSMFEFDPWHSKTYDVNDTIKDSQWYIERGSPDPDVVAEPSDPETRAAWLTAKHHGTPGITYLDSQGRIFMTRNSHGGGKTTDVYSESDLAGRFSKVYDQMDRMVSEGYVNMLGASIYGKTAERGERWVFSDVMGRMVKTWDNNLHEIWNTYDELNRTVDSYVRTDGNDYLFSKMVYGDFAPNALQNNLKGQAYMMFDQSGVTILTSIDFKGNALNIEKRLAKEYKQLVNWNVLDGLSGIPDINAAANPLLETETFSTQAEIDALNRPVLTTLPDGTVIRPAYNEANSLEKLDVQIRGQGEFVTYLENQDYDAKGQRQTATFGNGLLTKYFYDPLTFRLINLITKQDGAADSSAIQNISYTFDPVGNIVYTVDDAQQTHFFQNAVVKPESRFEYDPIYRCIKAGGREHAGNGGNQQVGHTDIPHIAQLPHINDSLAVRNYTENYSYDDCGNILQVQHQASSGNWTRHYRYYYQDVPSDKTNRLKSTSAPVDAAAGPHSDLYSYDIHGNMTSMPHLAGMAWNFMDQLNEVDMGGGGNAWYVYSLSGKRARKVIERNGGKRLERIYLGALEIYREYQANDKRFERNTVHVADSHGRIAQVDTKLLDLDNSDAGNPLNTNLVRYQFTNHLGSATLETDEAGNVISYEEYHPYGTTAYRSSKSGVDLSLKRFRFCGKERDDETGLYNMGTRYYAAWLGRWTSTDPAGFADGLNMFRYAKNNPVKLTDPSGNKPQLTSFNATPSEISYTGTEQQAIDYYNANPLVGTGTITDDETGETSTVRMSVRVVVRGVSREVQTGGEHVGEEFWQVSDFDFVPGSGHILTDADSGPEGASGGTTSPPPVQQGQPPTATPPGNTPPQPSTPPGTPVPPGGTDPNGSPTGTRGAAGSGSTPRERSWWERGGRTLLIGLGLVALGVLTVATGGGALVVAAGVMTAVAGGVMAGGSAGLMAASYSGMTTAQEDAEMMGYLDDVGLVGSTPFGLAGGALGYAIDGREGMRTGALIGGVTQFGYVAARAGLTRLAASASTKPWSYGATSAGALGETTALGQVTIKPGLSGAQLAETVTHEGVHAILSPSMGPQWLVNMRANIGMSGYNNSHLLKFVEEGLAQSAGTGSFIQGYSWIYSMRGVYKINMLRVFLEGGVYAGGTGAAAYGAYEYFNDE